MGMGIGKAVGISPDGRNGRNGTFQEQLLMLMIFENPRLQIPVNIRNCFCNSSIEMNIQEKDRQTNR
jgi:hypothetical protein